MPHPFKPKIAIITGAATGLGAAIARELSAAGTHVIVADIDLEKARATAVEIGGEAVPLDVSDAAQVEALVRKTKTEHGSLDLMVNNAGITNCGEILDLPLNEWRRVLDVNLWGVITGSVAAYSVMAKQRSGYIINIGSIAASLHNTLFGPYVTSKCGVLGFSKVLSIEAEGQGVHVSVVSPGNMKTRMVSEDKLGWYTPAVAIEDAARRILMGAAEHKRIIIFPRYARIIDRLERLNPNLLNGLRRGSVRDWRQGKEQFKTTTTADPPRSRSRISLLLRQRVKEHLIKFLLRLVV